MIRLAAHPLADLFPLIEGDDFAALVEDIRQHGVIDRIELLDGKILDGRNRYNALVHLVESGEVLGEGWGHRAGDALSPEGLQPDNQWFRKFNRHVDGDPLPWVLSKNLKRRHLDESQRAMVAARIANMGVGRPKAEFEAAPEHTPPIGGISAKATAAMLNVGSRSVERARTVLKEGAPELQHAVEQGKVAVSTAETIASLPQTEQAEVVARGPKEILAAAKKINAVRRRARFDQVQDKLVAISEGSKPLPTGQRYPIIYADPATRYVSGFGDRSIENHYPTMTTDELCALPVGELATKDAVLFIWSTVPQLANTLKIIEAWGFTYVSEWCWDKVDQGTGHWAFNAHEPLLIATRGNFPAPVPGNQPKSLYREKKGDHSAKPSWFAEQIESIWPKLPKIELFCRAPRLGWAAWGNQAGETADGAFSSLPAGESDPAATRDSPSAMAEDGGSVTPSSANEIPGEGASGTAREAPSAGSGDVNLASGVQPAPPQSHDDMLEIPAFLRRRPGNQLSELVEASHETA